MSFSRHSTHWSCAFVLPRSALFLPLGGTVDHEFSPVWLSFQYWAGDFCSSQGFGDMLLPGERLTRTGCDVPGHQDDWTWLQVLVAPLLGFEGLPTKISSADCFSTGWFCLLSTSVNFSLLRNIRRRKHWGVLMEEFSFCCTTSATFHVYGRKATERLSGNYVGCCRRSF